MAMKLNEKTIVTEKVIHLLTTSLCARNCKYCCNKQYNLNDIPYVTEDELRRAETICITGGEPFLFSNPCSIAKFLKSKYNNIKSVFVYSNAVELFVFLNKSNQINFIDGVNVSIKDTRDKYVFDNIIKNHKEIVKLKENRLYIFDDLTPESFGNFSPIKRDWQENFEPCNDSIFRKI